MCACTKQGFLKCHKAHFDSKCGCTNFKPAPLLTSDLLIRPQEMSLTPHEEKVLPTLIKRGMHNSHTLQVKTGEDRRTGENKIIMYAKRMPNA